MVIANIESNRPNLEVLFDTDNLDHAREVKRLLETLKSGYREELLEDEEMDETDEALKTLEEEFGVNIFNDSGEVLIDDRDYIPEISSVKILEVVEVK